MNECMDLDERDGHVATLSTHICYKLEKHLDVACRRNG
jgi:hypothetical protein